MAAGLVGRLMQRPRKKRAKTAMRLLEQAVHLLRMAPLELLPAYYIGSLPFVLGLLYFWSDMSRNAGAAEHAGFAALGMALLFVWMKTWQSIFSARVMARLGRPSAPIWSLPRLGSLMATQSLLQASGVVILPLAFSMTIPAGWCVAFYQNVTVLGGTETAGVRRLVREAWQQAGRWPYQNHKLLAVLVLFSLVVFINLATVVYWLPFGFKTLFGIDSLFTLNGFSLLNTTFLVTVLGLTYLCVDPLAKTVYALRCFDGFATVSGDDIRTELKSMMTGGRSIPTLLLTLLLSLPLAGSCNAESAAGTTVTVRDSRPLVTPEKLDRSIQRVLNRSEFAWRLPRTRSQAKTAQPSWLATMLTDTAKRIGAAIETVWNWIKRLGRWFRGLFDGKKPLDRETAETGDWMSPARGIIGALAVLLVVIGGGVLWKIRQKRSGLPPGPAPISAAAIGPDLEDENIRADDLPSERWIAVAADLLQQGRLRQALRAYFLASLAQLSEQGLITIQQYKSNRDYVRELGRRAHTQAELVARFAGQVSRFDRVWYGRHPVTDTEVRQYATMQQMGYHAANE